MVTDLGWLYLGGGTLLFFFWAYGIVSFARDLRRKFVPVVRRYGQGRRRLREEDEAEREREDRKRGLL